MNVETTPPYTDIDGTEVKIQNFLEVFLSQICGESKTLRPIMLNTLIVLATESDWALSTILEVEYIKPLEQYCEQTRPCDVSIDLPKLLIMIGKTSEDELDRICESSIPSSFLKWMISISDKNMINEIGNCLSLWTSTLRSSSTIIAHHKTDFLALMDHSKNTKSSIPHLTILAQLCFSPHLEVSKMTLKPLSARCKSDPETRPFLQKHKVPSDSTESSSELVPFAGCLCSTLAKLVSETKSLFAESSPSDGTISTLSTTLHEEPRLFTGNTVLEMFYEGFSLVDSLLLTKDDTFDDILIDHNFVPLLKSTIIACLDLVEQNKIHLKCVDESCSDKLKIMLNISWKYTGDSLHPSHKSLHPIVESTFSDVPQLCLLLERTCYHSSPTNFSHLHMIINIGGSLNHLIPRLLEETLVERVINASKPMVVPTTHGRFHLYLIWAIVNLIWNLKEIRKDEEERKRIRMLRFERVLNPAKRYLQFILQREEFILKATSGNYDLSTIVGFLLRKTLELERDLFEDGEIVETGREEWEVGWLVEKTKEDELGERLKMIREDDSKMEKKEKVRLKKRVERLREAGHSDAMEGWLTRRNNGTRSEIVEYLRHVSEESGMNVRF
ncbi:hypothetical protein BLNAU_8103 [Blattamonas nauphoetae]|uniref:Uncharacterized protein n=1 Tax=Blattamonas nauphoetae TaxID=2049346 RepID=A0ABQ9XZX7_9EUKA|nr:hypothetical protein BLNAU_8103 [Blattamonas nauphoetae]